MKILSRISFWRLLLLSLLAALVSTTAQAVPSYARQTGMTCEACHTTYPELTQFGRAFKMNGYTISGMQQVESQGSEKSPPLKINQIPPLSLMFETSATNVRNQWSDGTQTTPPINTAQKSSAEFPQQLSFFFAGEISSHMGSFIQLTYTHQQDHFTIDNSDLRYARQTAVADTPLTYGLTLNNNPTVEDPWQSTPAWGFPFVSPATLPKPNAGALIDGGMAQSVMGVGGYLHADGHWYLNLSGYRSELAGSSQPYLSSSAKGLIDGVAPYARLAYETTWGASYLEIGAYGIAVNKVPAGITGVSDRFLDKAIDAQLEQPFGNDSLVIRTTYILETTAWNASFPAGTVANSHDQLSTWHLNGSYHFANSQSLSLGYNRTSGSADSMLYAPLTAPTTTTPNPNTPYSGSANGRPDNTSWITQYVYLPWQNVQVGLQYTHYTRFNGASSNYDGAGRNAAANDTSMLYGWFMW